RPAGVGVSARHSRNFPRPQPERGQFRRGQCLGLCRARGRDRIELESGRDFRDPRGPHMRAGLKGFGVRGSGFGVLVLVLSSVGAKASAGQDGTLGNMLAQVANRVREYYSRAHSIVCTEKVSVQIIGRNLMPDGFARVLEYELRVEWDDAPESGEPPEARVLRELRKVNGRAAKPKDEPGCLDPKSGATEPLAFLLPHHREEYTFAWNGVDRMKDRRALTVDYRSRRPGPIEGKWKGDCVSIDAPGRTKGRIWVDETTNDVLRLDESLT